MREENHKVSKKYKKKEVAPCSILQSAKSFSNSFAEFFRPECAGKSLRDVLRLLSVHSHQYEPGYLLLPVL